jgi:predicted Rossmann fold nucleotide-binding protein DprA/Smf involved in DNA uptake
MTDKIDISSKVAEEMANALKDLLQRLQKEKSALDERIKQVESNLTTLGYKPDSPNRSGKPRRKWGINKDQIKEFLTANPNDKFKSDDIATKLNIARSSTLAVLIRLEKAGFTEQIDGLWKKK